MKIISNKMVKDNGNLIVRTFKKLFHFKHQKIINAQFCMILIMEKKYKKKLKLYLKENSCHAFTNDTIKLLIMI
jgi:hypothetical protein